MQVDYSHTNQLIIASEAMHYLNIPTTRAGSLVVSDSKARLLGVLNNMIRSTETLCTTVT